MKFEEVTLITDISYHIYLIEGICSFGKRGIMQTLEIQLDTAINLRDQFISIKFNGISFHCINITVKDKLITAEIIAISSEDYTDSVLN